MPRTSPAGRNSHFVANVVAGLAGGLVASYVMDQALAALGKLPSRDGAPGGGQPHPQPETEPATYKVADAIARAVSGHAVPHEHRPAAGAAVHYAFGGAVGAIYGAVAANHREITAVGGIPFGAAWWVVADEIAVPAARLAKGPTAYPVTIHASALAAHLVYGATTEAIRRALVHMFTRRPFTRHRD